MSTKSIRLALVISLAAVLIGSLLFIVYRINEQTNDVNSGSEINSFAECAAAGYPIRESFPEVCAVPGGKSFTNN